jgi:electron transfer flavoprotein-quinone oxidoreductase
MNYAVRSGLEAAEVALHARTAHDASAARLAEYDRRLESTGILPDFRDFENMDRVKWNPRFYTVYPKFAVELFHGMMTETGKPKVPMRRLLRAAQRAAGVPTTDVIRDGIGMFRDL